MDIAKQLEAIEKAIEEIDAKTNGKYRQQIATIKELLIVNCLMEEVKLDVKNKAHYTTDFTVEDYVNMTNSLVMSGAITEKAETDTKPQIRALLYQYIDDKMSREACRERAMFIAQESKVKDINAFMSDFDAKLEQVTEDKKPKAGK